MGIYNSIGCVVVERPTVEDLLTIFGLTEKEKEIYVFLSKHGIQKISQISNSMNINKGLVYRLLKSLEQKGFVEVTLENPTRYIPVEVEKIIDEYIESKRQEAAIIENSKQDLLSDWKEIEKPVLDSPLERFSIIESEKKVFNKICQMVKETKEELVSIATVNGLLRAETYGVLDNILNHPSMTKLKIRYITSANEDNISSIKYLMAKLNSVLSLRGKHPELQSNQLPRLVIKDGEEILLFINESPQIITDPSSDIVLCTNCKSIVHSFYDLFEDVWSKSSDIEVIIRQIEEGKPPEFMELLKDPIKAKRIFIDFLNNSKKEIFIVTSSERLIHIPKNIDLLKKWHSKGISIKIMAPVTVQNRKAVQQLLEFSDIRHIPVAYADLTIIDDSHLFQFNKFSPNYSNLNFEDVLYTNESNYIKKTKKILLELWKKTNNHPYTSIGK